MPRHQSDPTRNGLQVRSVGDLEEVARALAFHFQADTIVIVGSQAILVGWPEAPVVMRSSPEIDAYPANARLWEARINAKAKNAYEMAEASEDINAWFGQGSPFEKKWGFYIDGVDEGTARLPSGWQQRAIYREVEGSAGTITVVAPSPIDLVVSKLHRLEPKDQRYIETLHRARPLDRELVLERMRSCEPAPEIMARVEAFVQALPVIDPPADRPQVFAPLPRCPPGSHCRFIDSAGSTVTVRAWDEVRNVFYRIDNPLGPAVIKDGVESFFLDGKKLPEAEWRKAPRVVEAQPEAPAGPTPKWA